MMNTISKCFKNLFFSLLIISLPFLFAASNKTMPSSSKLRTLYHSLDPTSISQLFAFYQLYPESSYGKEALQKALQLMQKHRKQKQDVHEAMQLPPLDIEAIIQLTNQPAKSTKLILRETQLDLIESLSNHLANRKLKGHKIWNTEEILRLDSEEIDLARAIFLYELKDPLLVRQYEASLDLMTLQILARLPEDASPIQKIKAINHFIFHEMRFRFPPHSLWPKDVDTYTLLPAVMDNRQGVCLGVSILYLAIAQRLDFPLKIITPPGHIYIAYEEAGQERINIETTARGINMPSEVYLGINTKKLPERKLKEVIGMAFMNEAAIYLQNQNYEKALALYERAYPYLPSDPLLRMLLGFTYMFTDKKEKGTKLLSEMKGITFDEAVSQETMVEDLLDHKIDVEGIQTIFLPVSEKRESILEKQEKLRKIIEKHPCFREGLMQLAVSYLQLSRTKEALEILKNYEKIDPKCPTVQYYLSIISMNRLDLISAWNHLKAAEELTSQKKHYPRCLKELRRALQRQLPEHSI
ncbi:MAG: hypothetical protein Tsb0015_04740 [Simkaniaceae bacterium]